jgi:hypothetical protein
VFGVILLLIGSMIVFFCFFLPQSNLAYFLNLPNKTRDLEIENWESVKTCLGGKTKVLTIIIDNHHTNNSFMTLNPFDSFFQIIGLKIITF